jgi:hypothetical protein
MKDFMRDQGEYVGLKLEWPQKRDVLQNFINVIKATRLIGFGVGVDADAWREIPAEVTRVQGDAQQFCFMRIMKMVVRRMAKSAPRDVVAITFDCDKQFTPSRFQRYIGVRDHDPNARQLFQCFSIAEPKVFLPLQAADLLAWQTRKDLLRTLGGFESRPEFKFLFESLLNFIPDYESEMWDRSQIDKYILEPLRNGRKMMCGDENEEDTAARGDA